MPFQPFTRLLTRVDSQRHNEEFDGQSEIHLQMEGHSHQSIILLRVCLIQIALDAVAGKVYNCIESIRLNGVQHTV